MMTDVRPTRLTGGRLVRYLLLAMAGLATAPALRAQQILDVYRPRIAVAADGSFAVAYTARIQHGTTVDNVVVQRYAPDGSPVGPVHVFEGESCSALDLWTSDFTYNAELAFQSDGTLLVVMTHEGWFSIGVDDVYSSEATLGAIDANGQVIDLQPDVGACEQFRLIFPGGGRQTNPRLAIGPGDEILIAQQGQYQDAHYTNVAIRILDAAGNEIVEEAIPHDDPQSVSSFHQYPDLAASVRHLLVVWHECVVIDTRGSTDDCDIGAQFVDAQTLAAVGGNLTVNEAGVGQAGTYSVWPSVAMNAAGQSVVVWADSRTGLQGDVFAQRYDADAQPVGGNLQVSTGQGEITDRPEVALLPDGRFMVVWEDSSAAGFRAWSRTFDAEGRPLTPPIRLSDGQAALPAVAAGPGGFTTAWMTLGPEGRGIRTSRLGLLVANEPEAAGAVPGLWLEGYPNPFAGVATLRYGLEGTSAVQLAVYDGLGREVARLVDRVEGPGRYEVVLDGRAWPPGVYLVRLRQGTQTQTRVLVRR